MYEHVYYRKKEVRARQLLSSIIVKKMYEHVYYKRLLSSKKDVRARQKDVRFYYRKKDVRARLLS